MTLSQFTAYIKGYKQRMFDFKCLAVHAGYWAGYYSSSKKPKPLSKILEQLSSEEEKQDSINRPKERPDVDVEQFLAIERSFNERRNKM